MVLLVLFVGILFVIRNNDIEEEYADDIYKKTKIGDIEYLNKYDNYYIVMDSEYLYLINNKYKIISSLNRDLLYENKNNYDIIYSNDIFMYFNERLIDNKLIYEYYDIYSYELIDKIVVGGN